MEQKPGPKTSWLAVQLVGGWIVRVRAWFLSCEIGDPMDQHDDMWAIRHMKNNSLPVSRRLWYPWAPN